MAAADGQDKGDDSKKQGTRLDIYGLYRLYHNIWYLKLIYKCLAY